MAHAAPGNLTVAALGSTSLRLTWDDCATGEDSYIIDRLDNGAWVQLVVLAAGSTTHDDTGLSPSTAYTYRVYAYSAAQGDGDPAQASGTTDADGSAPNVPTNLDVISSSGNTVRVSFTDNATNEDGFDIQLSESPTFAASDPSTATVAAAAKSGTGTAYYNISGLQPSTLYYFRVRAHRTPASTRLNSQYTDSFAARTLSGQSIFEDTPPSAAAVFPTDDGIDPPKRIDLNPPDNMQATAGINKVTLSWSDTSLDNQGFIVYRSIDGGEFQELTRLADGITSWNNDGLDPVPHCYYLTSYRGSGTALDESEPSLTVCATPTQASSGESVERNGVRTWGGTIDGSTTFTELGNIAVDSRLQGFFVSSDAAYPGNLAHLVDYTSAIDYTILAHDSRRSGQCGGVRIEAGTNLRIYTPGGAGTDTHYTVKVEQL